MFKELRKYNTRKKKGRGTEKVIKFNERLVVVPGVGKSTDSNSQPMVKICKSGGDVLFVDI